MPMIQEQSTQKEIVVTLGNLMDISHLDLQQDLRPGAELNQVTLDFCLKTELQPQEIEWLQRLQHQCKQQDIQFRIKQIPSSLLKKLLQASLDFLDTVVD